jgi:hypothetical protein
MRALLAKGISASDIAIAAASPGDYDDHVFGATTIFQSTSWTA